jgi:hypothetical protein
VTEQTDASNNEPERPYEHRPVMVAEIVEALSTVPPGVAM